MCWGRVANPGIGACLWTKLPENKNARETWRKFGEKPRGWSEHSSYARRFREEQLHLRTMRWDVNWHPEMNVPRVDLCAWLHLASRWAMASRHASKVHRENAENGRKIRAREKVLHWKIWSVMLVKVKVLRRFIYEEGREKQQCWRGPAQTQTDIIKCRKWNWTWTQILMKNKANNFSSLVKHWEHLAVQVVDFTSLWSFYSFWICILPPSFPCCWMM